MLADPYGTNDITHDIIGGAIQIHRTIGPGLLESAYAACLALELSERGHAIERKKPVPLVYRSVRLDVAYYLDMLVDGRVICHGLAAERQERRGAFGTWCFAFARRLVL